MDLPDISYENKNIFSIPFFEWVNPHHSSIVDELLNVFYEYSKQNPQSDVTPHLKNNLYESPFSFMEDLENEKVIQFFRTYILESVGRITQDINREYWDTFKAKFGADKLFWKPYIQESWFHITKKADITVIITILIVIGDLYIILLVINQKSRQQIDFMM